MRVSAVRKAAAHADRSPTNHAELVAAAEAAGFDTVFTAEAWGSDAFTPLAWWGRETTRMRLGTSVVQLSARTPTACAMASLTLDHLSGGRHILGLGVSGPQVVEGWYGAKFPKPLARTREYIDVVRLVWAREALVTSAGPHYPLPLSGEGTTGLGKPLKPITHPLRADIPIMLGAEGPKNVALTAEIADGWLPIFYSPRIAPGALHGGDGCRGHQLPRRRVPPDGLLRGGRRRHPALPQRPQR